MWRFNKDLVGRWSLKDKNWMPGGEREKGRQWRESEAQALKILLSLWKTLCVDPWCLGINRLFDERSRIYWYSFFTWYYKNSFKKSMPKIYKTDQCKTEIWGNKVINISNWPNVNFQKKTDLSITWKSFGISLWESSPSKTISCYI